MESLGDSSVRHPGPHPRQSGSGKRGKFASTSVVDSDACGSRLATESRPLITERVIKKTSEAIKISFEAELTWPETLCKTDFRGVGSGEVVEIGDGGVNIPSRSSFSES